MWAASRQRRLRGRSGWPRVGWSRWCAKRMNSDRSRRSRVELEQGWQAQCTSAWVQHEVLWGRRPTRQPASHDGMHRGLGSRHHTMACIADSGGRLSERAMADSKHWRAVVPACSCATAYHMRTRRRRHRWKGVARVAQQYSLLNPAIIAARRTPGEQRHPIGGRLVLRG